MRILILHNEYQQYGGEDSVVKNEYDLLKKSGHFVDLEIISNHSIDGFLNKISAGLGLVFSWKSYFYIKKILNAKKPDIVHVHNFFPLWSPSIFYACKALNIPVVLTLHNYRIVCPTSVLMHEGKICEKSLTDGPWWAIKKKTYRNSFVGTFLLVLMIFIHKKLGTWNKLVDQFIVLSESSKQKFITAGFPKNKMIKKPNFIDIEYQPREFKLNFNFLYVGRLSEEKGIRVLESAVCYLQLDTKITIIGDGPLKQELLSSKNIDIKGRLKSNLVFNEMRKHYALILPSICLETFGMTVIEAYGNGLPVIGSKIGALEELIEHGVTGLLFEPGNPESLAQAMQWALDHPDEMYQMGLNARKRYKDLYTASTNLKQLESIYYNAIQSSKNESVI